MRNILTYPITNEEIEIFLDEITERYKSEQLFGGIELAVIVEIKERLYRLNDLMDGNI